MLNIFRLNSAFCDFPPKNHFLNLCKYYSNLMLCLFKSRSMLEYYLGAVNLLRIRQSYKHTYSYLTLVYILLVSVPWDNWLWPQCTSFAVAELGLDCWILLLCIGIIEYNSKKRYEGSLVIWCSSYKINYRGFIKYLIHKLHS